MSMSGNGPFRHAGFHHKLLFLKTFIKFFAVLLKTKIGLPKDLEVALMGFLSGVRENMRVGRFVSLPNQYSQFAQIKDELGNAYTVDGAQIPDGADTDDDYAYRVEIWGNDSGLAYDIQED